MAVAGGISRSLLLLLAVLDAVSPPADVIENEPLGGGELGGEEAVGAGAGDGLTQAGDDRGGGRGRLQRSPQLDARAAVTSSIARMRRRLSTARRSLRAACQPIETWSSCIAELGIESTLAGTARRLFSVTRAAWVYWAIIRPLSTPGSSARKGGSPCVRVLVEHAVGAALGDRPEVGGDDGEEVEDVADRARRGSCRCSRSCRPGARRGCRSAAASSRVGDSAGMGDRVAHGAGDLRARSAGSRRPAPGRRSPCATRRSPTRRASRSMFAALTAWPGCGRSGRGAPRGTPGRCRAALDAHGRGHVGDVAQLLEVGDRHDEHAEHAVGAVDEGEALLLPQLDGLDPGLGEQLGTGRSTPSAPTARPSPMSTSAQCDERGEVAAAAERAELVDDGGDAGVQQRGHRLATTGGRRCGRRRASSAAAA